MSTTSAPAPGDAAPSAPEGPITTAPKRVKVPTIIQQAQVECGAASLGMILAHFGRWETLEDLRTACGVTRDGADAPSIVAAAAGYGLDYTAVRGDIEKLRDYPVPSIAWVRRSHFVVLEGIHGGRVYLNDPAHGPRSETIDEFALEYSGVAINFTKNASFTP
ncbi:MAG TPA: hypothetical protein DCQ36_12290, partial [Actinobacteria bacterium]|nr:hypothetical protein [Actinomycetota bacterium]